MITLAGIVLLGAVDYLSGYEVSFSLFYLAPVAFATWYINRTAGVICAVLSCLIWYLADFTSGHQYSNAAIPVWNAIVRLGFFLITALLLTSLRTVLTNQQHLARTDALTGLFGRRAFEERLAHDLALAQRNHSLLTLVYVDLDDFKSVNDQQGHAAGDRVLRLVGDCLSATVRATDTAARLGGDEFALVLPDTNSDEARGVVLKVRNKLQQSLRDANWNVTCSMGAVTFVSPQMSPPEALARADKLMYRVKRQGKDALEFELEAE